MKDAIKILRGQAVLCTRLLGMFDKLLEALKTDTAGAGVSKAVQDIEPPMAELSKLLSEQQRFLEAHGQPDMRSFMQAQAVSTERDVAMRLLGQAGALQEDLRKKARESELLLQRSKDFIDYHINVISQARASVTYGAPSAEAMEGQRGQRIFDRNV